MGSYDWPKKKSNDISLPSKRHAVTGEWRRLHNEELCDVYSSPNVVGEQIKKNKLSGICSTYGKRRVAYRILMGRHEGRRPLGRPRNRWENDIKMCLQEMIWGMD
jgi:hypothetical protein